MKKVAFPPALTSGVSVAERRVEAHVDQLASLHVLLLGRHVGEEHAAVSDAQRGRLRHHVGLAVAGESQQPQHVVGYALQDLRGRR